MFHKAVYENETESEDQSAEEDGAYGGAYGGDDTLEDVEFIAPTPQMRRGTSKKNWITPRLCAALDKAKVKRMRVRK